MPYAEAGEKIEGMNVGVDECENGGTAFQLYFMLHLTDEPT